MSSSLRYLEDFHVLSLCLTHKLATTAQIEQIMLAQHETSSATLGQMLVSEGILRQDQYELILREVVHNPRVVSALTGLPLPAPAPAPAAAPPQSDFDKTLQDDVHAAATLAAGFLHPPGNPPGTPHSPSPASEALTASLDDVRTIQLPTATDLANTRTLSDSPGAGLANAPATGAMNPVAGNSAHAAAHAHPSHAPHSRPPAAAAASVSPGVSKSPQAGLSRASGSLMASLGAASSPGAVTAGSMAGASFTELIRRRSSKSGGPEQLEGSVVSGYRIEGRLGKGGQGEVYSARQLSLDRLVALKVLPPELAHNAGFIQNFISEARTLATFSHPNIVQVFDVAVENDVYFFTMERITGEPLKDLIVKEGRLPVAVATNLLKQSLRGLERAARAGIIHRDIKPGNILVDDQGQLKLVDFGLALRGDVPVAGESVVGTPYYMSPEQAQGRDITSASDQYSLGATFYHVLTGEPPYKARALQKILEMHVHDPIPDPCAQNPDIPPDLGALIRRMMAKDPAQRFPDFKQLFQAVEAIELREGLIEARSSFLAEGLANIGERSARNLWINAILMIVAGIAFTGLAVGASLLLDRLRLDPWKAPIGNIGAGLLVLAVAAIGYIAAVRKGWLPKFGNIRTWLQVHIAFALAGYFLSMVHSGNFVRALGGPIAEQMPDGTTVYHVVPWIPFLNSIAFTFVIVSGLIGRYIWRDIAKQIAVDRISRGLEPLNESHEFTLGVFAQRALRYWRIFHYPMAVVLVLLTVIHVASILYFG